MICAVKNCRSKISPTNRGYCFPTNEGHRKQWLKFCGLSEKTDTKSVRICMKHFKPEDFGNGMKYNMGFAMRRVLSQGVIPSINAAAIKNMEIHKEREQRKEKRENKKIVAELLHQHMLLEKAILDEKEFEPTAQMDEGEDPLNENVLPNLNDEEDCIKSLRNELDALRKENQALKRSYSFELKAKEENIAKISKVTQIYEHNLDVLNKRLVAANDEVSSLKKINKRTTNKKTKLKQPPNEL